MIHFFRFLEITSLILHCFYLCRDVLQWCDCGGKSIALFGLLLLWKLAESGIWNNWSNYFRCFYNVWFLPWVYGWSYRTSFIIIIFFLQCFCCFYRFYFFHVLRFTNPLVFETGRICWQPLEAMRKGCCDLLANWNLSKGKTFKKTIQNIFIFIWFATDNKKLII